MQHFKISLPTKITYGSDLKDMEGSTFSLTKSEARAIRNAYFLRSTLIYIAPVISALLIVFAFAYALPKAPDLFLIFLTSLSAGLALALARTPFIEIVEKRIASVASKVIETRAP